MSQNFIASYNSFVHENQKEDIKTTNMLKRRNETGKTSSIN